MNDRPTIWSWQAYPVVILKVASVCARYIGYYVWKIVISEVDMSFLISKKFQYFFLLSTVDLLFFYYLNITIQIVFPFYGMITSLLANLFIKVIVQKLNVFRCIFLNIIECIIVFQSWSWNEINLFVAGYFRHLTRQNSLTSNPKLNFHKVFFVVVGHRYPPSCPCTHFGKHLGSPLYIATHYRPQPSP